MRERESSFVFEQVFDHVVQQDDQGVLLYQVVSNPQQGLCRFGESFSLDHAYRLLMFKMEDFAPEIAPFYSLTTLLNMLKIMDFASSISKISRPPRGLRLCPQVTTLLSHVIYRVFSR